MRAGNSYWRTLIIFKSLEKDLKKLIRTDIKRKNLIYLGRGFKSERNFYFHKDVYEKFKHESPHLNRIYEIIYLIETKINKYKNIWIVDKKKRTTNFDYLFVESAIEMYVDEALLNAEYHSFFVYVVNVFVYFDV